MKTSKTRNVVIAVLIMVPLLCCVGGAYFFTQKVDFRQEAAKLDDELKKAKVAGLPMSREQVEPGPVPDEKNSMVVYQDLLKNWPKKWPDKEINSRFAKMTESSELFPEFDPFIARLRSRPFLKLNKDWDLGNEVLYPELAKARGLVKVIGLKAIVAARKRDANAVRTHLNQMINITENFQKSPTMIPLLSGFMLRGITEKVAVSTVLVSEGNGEVEKVAREAINHQYPVVDYKRVVGGEFYSGLAIMRNVQLTKSSDREDGKAPAWTKNPIRSGVPKHTPNRAYLAAYCRHMVAILKLWDANINSPELPQILVDYTDNIPQTASNIMSHFLIPMLGGTVKTERRAGVRKDLALATLDLYRWSRQNKKVPDSASQAGISLVDAYSKKPLTIRQEGNKVMLYCVGLNQKDEGGPASRGRASDDIGFSFEMSPR